MGQKSLNFCDTTQIDVLENARSLTRTIIRAPMDNGWDSRRPLLGFLFGPPSEVHSPADSCSDPTARNSLKGHLDWVLLSVIGLL